MKTIFTVCMLSLIGCGTDSAERMKPSQEDIARTIEYIKTENSEVVVDVAYNDGGVYNWLVGVNDNGTNRKGLASAICNDLYSTGILTQANKSTTVNHGIRIVDVVKFSSSGGNSRTASMGSADCKTFAMSDM